MGIWGNVLVFAFLAWCWTLLVFCCLDMRHFPWWHSEVCIWVQNPTWMQNFRGDTIKKKLQLCTKWVLDSCGVLRQRLLESAVFPKSSAGACALHGLVVLCHSHAGSHLWRLVQDPRVLLRCLWQEPGAGIAPWASWCQQLGSGRASFSSMCSWHLIGGNERVVSLTALRCANRIGAQKCK